MIRSYNFLQDILEAVGDESIEAIVINSTDGMINKYRYKDETDSRDIPLEKCNISLTIEEASTLLNYSYNCGYGSMDCHDITMWTAKNVYYIYEYDGSTEIHSVPRNPPSKDNQS